MYTSVPTETSTSTPLLFKERGRGTGTDSWLRKTGDPTLVWGNNVSVRVVGVETTFTVSVRVGWSTSRARSSHKRDQRRGKCEETIRREREERPRREGLPIWWPLGRRGDPGRSGHIDNVRFTHGPLQTSQRPLYHCVPDSKGLNLCQGVRHMSFISWVVVSNLDRPPVHWNALDHQTTLREFFRDLTVSVVTNPKVPFSSWESSLWPSDDVPVALCYGVCGWENYFIVQETQGSVRDGRSTKEETDTGSKKDTQKVSEAVKGELLKKKKDFLWP